MNFRQTLADIIILLDKYPQIKTEKLTASAIKALKTFREKFEKTISLLEEEGALEELKSQLVKMTHIETQAKIEKLNQKDFSALCKILSIKPRATKNLSARLAGEAKLVKKISDIRKQTH